LQAFSLTLSRTHVIKAFVILLVYSQNNPHAMSYIGLYFMRSSFLAASFFATLVLGGVFSAQAAEDPSLDTLFGFTNQPPQSGDQPPAPSQNPKDAIPAVGLPPQNASAQAPAQPPAVTAPSKPEMKSEPLFGMAPQKPAPMAPVDTSASPKEMAPRFVAPQVIEPKPVEPKVAVPVAPKVPENKVSAPKEMAPQPVAPVRVLPSQMVKTDTPPAPHNTMMPAAAPETKKPEPKANALLGTKPDTAPVSETVKQPTKPTKPAVATTRPEPAPITPIAPAATATMPSAAMQQPEHAKVTTPPPSASPQHKNKTHKNKTYGSSKKSVQKATPKTLMSDQERRQKTQTMLAKSYDTLTMALRIDFPAFSSALPRQARTDLQDRISALKPEELVVLYGSASIGPKGTGAAAQAVAQGRMDRIGTFLQSLGVKQDRIVKVDRAFTRTDTVDIAFVVVKAKRDERP
jgi:hypothetical protein